METKWSRHYGADVFTPDINENQSAYEAFRESALKHSDRIALEFGKRKFTYKELLAEIDRYASILAANGVYPGGRVMISCRRMPHQIIAFYAINKIGASVCFVMRNASPEIYQRVGVAVKASHIIFTVEIYERYKEMFRHTPIHQIILAKSTDYALSSDLLNPNMWDLKMHEKYDVEQDKGAPGPQIVLWKDLWKDDLPEVSRPIAPDEPAVYFTSGTAAGSVNIVKISSRSLNAQAKQCAFLLGRNNSRVFSFIRMDFSYGMCFALHTTLLNGHTYLINTQKELEFSAHDINIYKPDIIIGYPQMLTSLIDSGAINGKALKTLKAIYSCGNIMSGIDYYRLREFFDKRHLEPKIVRLYGITETCSVCMYLPQAEVRPYALGIPLPGINMKIVDPDTNSEVSHGQSGVIAINTPASMLGYAEADDDTATVMRKLHDNKTWILTGDIGVEGDDGIFYYQGTRRRVFDRGGMHIYPQLIEDTIRNIIGVEDCCAVPLEDGDDIKVKVAIKPEHDYLFNNDKLNELKDNIERTCEMEMVAPMCPDEYEFMAYLPTGKYGRVDYEAIIKMFKEENDEQEDLKDDLSDVDPRDGV